MILWVYTEIKVDITIERCKINNKILKFEDKIPNVLIGKTPEGIVCLNISTKDKYVYIESHKSINIIEKTDKTIIEIMPIINKDSVCLSESDFDEYMHHENFYDIWLGLDCVDESSCFITPLKHEYMINFIPNKMIFNHGCMENANIIKIGE
jgi:hypothetical protein